MAAAVDLKSTDLTVVSVRVRVPAPLMEIKSIWQTACFGYKKLRVQVSHLQPIKIWFIYKILVYFIYKLNKKYLIYIRKDMTKKG